MNYRRIPNDSLWFFRNSSVGGIGTIGTAATLDGKFIGTGVTALGLLNRLTRTQVIVLHEVCHYFFGHTSLGLMTPGHGGSSYQMSPHKREAIGYIQPIVVNSGSGTQTFTLRDYIKYGDCLKVPIPNTSEYYYIANHQKKSKYDGLARGSNTCWLSSRAEQDPYCDKNKGLYIYHSAGGCSNNFGREIDLENAEGKWDWEVAYTVNDPQLGNTPIMYEITRNTSTGSEEYGKQMIPNVYSPIIINDDLCSNDPNDYTITFDDKGDELDAYNNDYDEIFSPWSNPSSNSCSNPSTNSGLTFNLESQDTSGAITIKVYFNDVTALLELPPSKPKNVKVSRDLITQSSYHPKVKWDANIEPDFVSATYGTALVEPRYQIYRGHSEYCDTEPTYTYLTSVASDVTEYTDNSVTLYFANEFNPGPGCALYIRTYSYKVVAKDNRGMSSLKSQRGLITDYIIACFGEADPEGPDNLSFNLDIPKEYKIYQNYPNPFNPVTNIQYDLPFDNFVSIKIYDVLGKEISTLINEFKQAGSYITSFNGSNLPSGIYYYKIIAGSFEQVRKMILIK